MGGQVYCVKENQIADIYFSFFFKVSIFPSLTHARFFLFLLCFDLLLYVHGKQLGSCRDSPLLNRTVPRQISCRQFTSI